jgi:transcriptional regulator GlxA family with amidase domain
VLDSAMPMMEIAETCGFANASHLSKAYRVAFGMPPRRARIQRQGTTAG